MLPDLNTSPIPTPNPSPSPNPQPQPRRQFVTGEEGAPTFYELVYNYVGFLALLIFGYVSIFALVTPAPLLCPHISRTSLARLEPPLLPYPRTPVPPYPPSAPPSQAGAPCLLPPGRCHCSRTRSSASTPSPRAR